MSTFHDISVTLGSESAVYPGDPPFSIRTKCSLEQGDPFRLSEISMGIHEGTHLDFPAHFIAGGREAAEYPLDRFVLPARVVEATGGRVVCSLPEGTYNPGEAVLFKTDNSLRGIPTGGRFVDDYTVLSLQAARQCVAKGVSLVGIDAFSVEDGSDPAFPVHHHLLSGGVLILENINLAGVPAGVYRLYCFPLKMDNAEASPVRAVLESMEMDFS